MGKKNFQNYLFLLQAASSFGFGFLPDATACTTCKFSLNSCKLLRLKNLCIFCFTYFSRGKTHTDRCMHHIRHPLRLRFDASAAGTSLSVLSLYSGAINIAGPDVKPDESLSSAEGLLLDLLQIMFELIIGRFVVGIIWRGRWQLEQLQRWFCPRLALHCFSGNVPFFPRISFFCS